MLWLKLLAAVHVLAAWNANDLSILLPLPKPGEEEMMIRPSPALLPKPLYDFLPNMLIRPDRETVYNQLLKVIAIRVDACFQEGDSPCQKQIRLVWQPITFRDGKATTLDGAIHSFHAFNDETFAAMTADLKKLRLTHGPSDLGVHPLLSKEGYGRHWGKLKNLIAKYCHEKNLIRATMMTSNPLGTIWTFSGVDIIEGEFKRIEIPRVKSPVQGFFTAPQNETTEFRSGMNPEPPGESDFVALLKNSMEAKNNMTERSLIEATKSALKIENPRLTNPGTVDCASCHSAHVIPLWSMKNFSWNWEDTFAAELYARLKPEGKQEPINVLRAFGYFEDRPVVSRRVANETKEAVALFNKENP